MMLLADAEQGVFQRGFDPTRLDGQWTRCELPDNCRNTFGIATILHRRLRRRGAARRTGVARSALARGDRPSTRRSSSSARRSTTSSPRATRRRACSWRRRRGRCATGFARRTRCRVVGEPRPAQHRVRDRAPDEGLGVRLRGPRRRRRRLRPPAVRRTQPGCRRVQPGRAQGRCFPCRCRCDTTGLTITESRLVSPPPRASSTAVRQRS